MPEIIREDDRLVKTNGPYLITLGKQVDICEIMRLFEDRLVEILTLKDCDRKLCDRDDWLVRYQSDSKILLSSSQQITLMQKNLSHTGCQCGTIMSGYHMRGVISFMSSQKAYKHLPALLQPRTLILCYPSGGSFPSES